jgi:hypothetical protein
MTTVYSSWSTPVFLEILVHNLPPRTTGDSDHRYCRRIQIGRHSVQVPTPDPSARMLSSLTGLLYPVTSSLLYPVTSSPVSKILDNTQPHSSTTTRTGMVRPVGLNEDSYTPEVRLSPLSTSSRMSKKCPKSVYHMYKESKITQSLIYWD